jgi:hypothetical protein
LLAANQVVFLLDVDNTLLDNDRFAADFGVRLEQEFGAAGRERYWALYAKLREALGYAGYLGTLQAFRAGFDDDPDLLQMSGFLLDYPFAQRLYLHALETIAQRAIEAVQQRYPAPHYVMVDDKAQLLAAMKQVLGASLTTVFVRQGHYARESAGTAIDPSPDLAIERIGELTVSTARDSRRSWRRWLRLRLRAHLPRSRHERDPAAARSRPEPVAG